MSTVYINGTTSASNGDDFTLSTGSSRTFIASTDDNSIGVPPDCVLELQIKESINSGYIRVGTLCDFNNPVGVVTARGAGDSTFRVVKSATALAIEVLFD
tara:strand:- start:410 stop:709 length:300 start_codon:yes stop_codon:yes gene_type:complete